MMLTCVQPPPRCRIIVLDSLEDPRTAPAAHKDVLKSLYSWMEGRFQAEFDRPFHKGWTYERLTKFPLLVSRIPCAALSDLGDVF